MEEPKVYVVEKEVEVDSRSQWSIPQWIPPAEKPPSVTSDDEPVKGDIQSEWKPDKQVYVIMGALSLILFVVALDATILVAALPVGSLNGVKPLYIPLTLNRQSQTL